MISPIPTSALEVFNAFHCFIYIRNPSNTISWTTENPNICYPVCCSSQIKMYSTSLVNEQPNILKIVPHCKLSEQGAVQTTYFTDKIAL